MMVLKAVMLLCVFAVPAVAQLPFPGIPGGGGSLPDAFPATVQSVYAAINPNCARTHVVNNACEGVADLLSYWAPTHWVEVTGRTNEPVVQGATPVQTFGGLGTPNPFISGGGADESGSLSGEGATNIHFKEARVYEMPLPLLRLCDECDGNSTSAFQVNYISDTDPLWRTQTSVPIPGLTGSGLPLFDFGVWGPIYPRHGKVIHGSEVVAAAHAAARAMHIASLPIETNPPAVRPIQFPAPPPACFQVAHPRQSQCLPPGASPIYFETFRLEAGGKYVFIHWTLKICCTDASTSNSCLTLNSGVENFCEFGVGPLGFVPGAIPFK